MKPLRIVCLLALGMLGVRGQSVPQPTLASLLDAEISKAEKEIVAAADAMPEDKFYFTPEDLGVTGADFKGVRNFAVLVKHTAASNYALFSSLTGDQIPKDYFGGDGPPDLKTKAEIMKFLKNSYALGHKAAASLAPENMLRYDEATKSYRLHLAIFALTDGSDHYGQLVEYLRMNGIVPPASRRP